MVEARLSGVEWEPAAEAVDDASLARLLGVDASVPERLSGGRVRHLAPDGEGPSDMAARAARRLLERRAIAAGKLDLILFSTNTPDIVFPGSACLLQAALEGPVVACLDIRSQCTGFIAALVLARAYVACGGYERILVAAGEVPSHQNRFDGVASELACLTADGAAVALVEAGEGRGRILACRQRVDGRRHREFWCEAPASRNLVSDGVARGQRLTRQMFEAGSLYPTIDLEATRATALQNVPRVFDEALANAGLETVDALMLAHVDPRVEAELAEILAARAGRVITGDHVYSYSASLPAALARALDRGAVSEGETVAMATAGQGASWGAAVVRV